MSLAFSDDDLELVVKASERMDATRSFLTGHGAKGRDSRSLLLK
jgi:hypothetical protein